MNKYSLKVIDLRYVRNADDYDKAYKSAKEVICDGLDDLFKKAGGRLYRGRNGYSAIKDSFEYVAVRV